MVEGIDEGIEGMTIGIEGMTIGIETGGMSGHGSSLDFVFSNLISGRYDGASISFIPNSSKLLFPQGNRLTIFDVARGFSQTHGLEHPATITTAVVSECGRYIVSADRRNTFYISEMRPGGFAYTVDSKSRLLHSRSPRPVRALQLRARTGSFCIAIRHKFPS
jgi:hypothetical protein